MDPNIQLHEFGTVDFAALRTGIDWQQRTVTVYGKEHPQPRRTRWYGPTAYVYSNLRWEAQAMPTLLENLRQRIEARTGERFNSVLCNLYRDGADCVGWHSDDEPIFGLDPVVASLSFGASRDFQLRSKDKSVRKSYTLTDGSLLVMGRGVQGAWQHSIPRTKKVTGERINLTFRLALC